MGYTPPIISILQILSKVQVKQSCYVATTGNISLSGLQTIDGLPVPSGTRVLVKDQINKINNGIYVVSSGSWVRSFDANDNDEMESGILIYIQAGDLQQETQWYLATEDPIVLGSTSLVFHQFSGSPTGILPGNGLTLTGTILDIVPDADASIVVGPDTIKVGVLASDTQHGVRGNGTQHTVADLNNNGFFSKEDFSKLGGLDPYLSPKNSVITYLGNGDIDKIENTGYRTETIQFIYTLGELTSIETTVGLKKKIVVFNYTGSDLTSITTTVEDI